MNSVGGFFELEIMKKDAFIHKSAILLNSGRSCFEYIIKLLKIKKVYISYYNCEVIVQTLDKLGVSYAFYNMNENLELVGDICLKQDEFLLYINYFSTKGDYVSKLVQMYSDKIIIDNSQAFYSNPIDGVPTFYSPRKFFGVPDGGCLYVQNEKFEVVDNGISYPNCTHLLKRLDLGPEIAYNDYLINEKNISNTGMLSMSNLTKSILNSIDYDLIKYKRLANFYMLHSNLFKINKLSVGFNKICCPLVYPLLINDSTLKSKLILNKIYTATYWPNVLNWAKADMFEYYLASNLLALPIDQRYTIDDMNRILEVIYG